MITLVLLAKRSAGIDIQTFQQHVGTPVDLADATHLGVRRATQSLTLPGAYRKGEPIYDVVDELAFDDEAGAVRCLAESALDQAPVGELLDATSVTWLLVQEHVVKDGPIPRSGVKNFEFVSKRTDMDRDDFDRYWIEAHGPLAAGIGPIRRYVQAHLAPGIRRRETWPYDGLAITWFDDVTAMRAGAQTEVYRRTRADELNFLAGELPFIITTERTIFTH